MPGFRFGGPECRYRLLTAIDPGTLVRQRTPPPCPTGTLSLWPELHDPDFLTSAVGLDSAITDADKAEFETVKHMPVLDNRRRSFKNVHRYVSARTVYFGSHSAYADFAAESDAELANTEWKRRHRTRTLRSMIEFNGRSQTKKQQIFYRWVRKAYKKKYGDDVDVPELIRKGMSDALAGKIADIRGSVRVKGIHDENFSAGGFNPRPIKYKGAYMLGTLSEHATGMAVDIDDAKNAQLTNEEWKFIEDLVGKKVSRNKERWDTEDDVEDFWTDVKALSDGFVAKVASEITRIEKERTEKERREKELAANQKAPANPPQPHPHKVAKVLPPLQELLGKHYNGLSKWVTSGFFNLPLELVLELHAHGFTWGATFGSNVDLHHFELD